MPPLKNRTYFSELNDKTKLAIQRWFCFCSLTCQPTVCVTRAGAGGGTLSNWEKAEA